MPIITDGLLNYFNFNQGVTETVWENIAPSTIGSYNGTITGGVLQSNGVYFSGTASKTVKFPYAPALDEKNISFTLNFGFIPLETNLSHFLMGASYASIAVNRIGLELFRVSNNAIVNHIMNFGQNLVIGTEYDLCITYDVNTLSLKGYLNGVLFSTITTVEAMYIGYWNTNNFFTMGNNNYIVTIQHVKYYIKALSQEEVTTNYLNGTNIGLGSSNAFPIVSIINTSKTTISGEAEMNQSIITIQFSTDVTQYVARVNGVDQNTGMLIHSGGAVSANTDAQIIVDWNELLSEGLNRINIYGQNADGWTPYT